MKKNKKTRSNVFTIVFLILLLCVVLLYLGLVYPRLNERIVKLDSDYNLLSTKIRLIEPYESKIKELTDQAETLKKDFDSNTDLHEAVLFSNILYKAADEAGVIITNLTIAENSPVELEGGYSARNFSAELSLTTNGDGKVSNKFIQLLESDEGCAMYVTSVGYSIINAALSTDTDETADDTTDDTDDDTKPDKKSTPAVITVPDLAAETETVSMTVNLFSVEKE